MRTYNNCNRPNACCVEIDHDEENDTYILYDNDTKWTSKEMTFEQLVRLKELICQIEDEKEDINDLE
jgi:hypothetical protein